MDGPDEIESGNGRRGEKRTGRTYIMIRPLRYSISLYHLYFSSERYHTTYWRFGVL